MAEEWSVDGEGIGSELRIDLGSERLMAEFPSEWTFDMVGGDGQPIVWNEVAASVGYQSEAAFNRAFRRHVGVGPGRYRAQRDQELRA